MTNAKSSIAKGLIAAACCVAAIVAGVASARQEAQAAQTHEVRQPS